MIPIKTGKMIPPPPVPAALGMALAYYTYPFLNSVFPAQYFILCLLFFLAAAVSFLRVLRLASNILPLENFSARKLGIITLALALGFSLGIAARRSAPGPAETGLEAEKVIAVSGILREDPRSLQGGSGLGVLELRQCAGDGGLRASARGNLTVFFPADSIPRLKEFGRGCEIYADGKLSAGVRTGSRSLLFNASSVHIVKPAAGPDTFRTGLRMRLLEKFQSRPGSRTGPPVWGALASALLLGVRDDLDVDLANGFRNSGCSYILALSGMHLAIISGLLAFLIRRPLGIRWASLAGAGFIIFYVFVAGSQPSLVRAAIMYLIGTAAVWGLLNRKPLPLLCTAFVLQLLLQSDTGTSLSFILSYMALFGILTLGETLRTLFRGRLPEILNGSLSASLGAFIFTAPVMALYFASLKPIGILAGPPLAALSSVFMVLALAALGASFLPLPLWDLLDFILALFYRLIEFLVSLAGLVPGFSVTNPIPVLIFSCLAWFLVFFIQRRDYSCRSSIASFN